MIRISILIMEVMIIDLYKWLDLIDCSSLTHLWSVCYLAALKSDDGNNGYDDNDYDNDGDYDDTRSDDNNYQCFEINYSTLKHW